MSLPGWFGWAVFGLLNGAGLFLTGLDKSKARHGRWRIRERTFFILAVLGGGIGVYGGCLLFRHKTRHARFMLGLPAILLAQLVLCFWLLHYGRG